MAKYTAWCDELAADLKAPFPPALVSMKEVGKGQKKAQVAFVSWHHYAARLNELVGPGWSMGTPIIQDVAGKLIVGVPVTVLGVTRINFGDENEEETNAEGKSIMYGTPITNAYAQAFKRTCALFGVGLYLYDKEMRVAALRGAQRAARKNGNGNGNGNGHAGEPAVNRIKELLGTRKVGREHYNRIFDALAHMNDDEARRTIQWLERREEL